MVKDVKVQKIFEVLFAPENVREIFRGTLPTCLNETENLIFNIKYAFSGV